MKCTGCESHMLLDRSESTATASTHWYRCPLCSKVRLTSVLNPSRPERYIGQHSIEDGFEHATDHVGADTGFADDDSKQGVFPPDSAFN